MTENGNSEPTGVAAPPAPPVPPVHAPTVPGPGLPPGQPKEKMDVILFILGFISPVVFLGLATVIGSVLQSDVVVFGAQAFAGLLFFVFVAAFAVGKSKRIRRLWSYGLGGLAAYAFGGLLLLLAFGTCLVTLTGAGLLGAS